MICVVTVDFICILIVGLPCLLLNLIGEPYKRGFFCSDTTIRHPYLDSTVPTWALILISYSLPTIIIALVETSLLKHSNTSVRLTREMYKTFMGFVFGFCVNQLMTDISKFTIGRLRPHFFEVCSPNVTLSEDLDYLTDFQCLGQQNITADQMEKRMHNMRLSFVSGHASLSAYSMWFCVSILQRMDTRKFRLVKPLIQVCCALFAVVTSLTRVSDYKHHPEDVVCGAMLGFVISSLTIKFLVRREERPLVKSREKDLKS